MEPRPRPHRYRFGPCTLDLAAWQLRRDGRVVKLERQPMELLILLVTRQGDLVPRAEIADRLWGADVFVDVETGVNTAIRKIRQALRDAPDAPTFVETVPGKGYRFIAPVDVDPPELGGPPAGDARAAQVSAGAAPEGGGAVEPEPGGPPTRSARRRWRFPVAAAVLAALAAIAWSMAPSPDVTDGSITLAVLPFQNIGRDPERDYLAEGLTEETIHSLAQIDPGRVLVIGRTSTAGYKTTVKTLATIGQELDADFIVEGSVRAEASSVRVATRLVRASDQVQVWADAYDRRPDSLLDFQTELSRDIAEQVRLRLSSERTAAVARRQPREPEAFDLYMRGRFYHNQLTPQTVVRGLDYYRQAVAIDPSYALAWAGTATALTSRPMNSDVAPDTVAAAARDAARRAVREAPDLAEAQLARGSVAFALEWQWPEAERALRRATELDPSSALSHLMLGHTLSQMRRHEDARRHTARARKLDPFYGFTHALSSQVAFQAGDFEAALQHARTATAIDPEFWIGYMQLGQVLLQLGRYEDAIEAFTRSSRFSAGNSKPLAHRGYALAAAGRTDEARQVLEALHALAAERYVPPYAIALVHAGLGETDAALDWLERGSDVRDVHLIFLPVDPKWDEYRSQPRFNALVRKCGF